VHDRLGLKVAIADINTKGLDVLAKELGGKYGESNVLAVPTDVSKLEDVVHLRERVYEAWGEVSVVRRGSRSCWSVALSGVRLALTCF
jgi:hypothetical protein